MDNNYPNPTSHATLAFPITWNENYTEQKFIKSDGTVYNRKINGNGNFTEWEVKDKFEVLSYDSINDIDLNIKTGVYIVCINGQYGYYITDIIAPLYVKRQACVKINNKCYINSLINDTWKGWKEYGINENK